jgi:hypothetical protein
MDNSSGFSGWPIWWWEWPRLMMEEMRSASVSSAPQELNQSILPGWMFANSINVTEENSSAPETERRIVSAHSYGRQLGRVMDAVAELIAERPKAAREVQAFQDFEELRREVDEIKTRATTKQLDHFVDELIELKRRNSDEYQRLAAELRNVLDD